MWYYCDPHLNFILFIETSAVVDGGYSEWTKWSECSQSCGGGVKVRARSCTNPSPSGGGKDCTSLGESEELAKCNEQACKNSKYLLASDVSSFH